MSSQDRSHRSLSKLALAERRRRVADFYLEGWSQRAIAGELGVAQSTVSSDFKALEREWRASGVRDFDSARGLELKKLERLEREAWGGWQRSQEPLESTRVVQDAGGKRAEKQVRQQHGDPRFLEQIQRCIAARRALLGLDAPARIAPTSPDGEEAYHSHVMAELMRLAEQTRPGPVIIDGKFIEQVHEGSLPATDAGAGSNQVAFQGEADMSGTESEQA